MGALPHLTGIRGVAALAVLAFHAIVIYDAQSPIEPAAIWRFTASYGYLGVDLFFVLSGFLLARTLLTHNQRPTWSAWSQFMQRRWIRTAPAYYVAILAALFLAGRFHTAWQQPGNLLAHLFYVPNYDAQVVGSNNVAFWSLAVEFQIYLLVPLLVWWLTKQPRTTLAILALLSLAWPLLLVKQGAPSHNFWVITQAPAYFFHFGIGITAARMHAQGWHPRVSPRLLTGACLLGILGTSLLAFPPPGLWQPLPDRFALAMFRVFPAVGFATLILLLAQARGNAYRFFASTPIEFGGRISYSLYLIHAPLMHFIAAHAGWTLQLDFSLYLLLTLLVCLPVAWLLYVLVERPVLEWKGRSSRTPIPARVVAPAMPQASPSPHS